MDGSWATRIAEDAIRGLKIGCAVVSLVSLGIGVLIGWLIFRFVV